ncbi:MAG: helix-turn-helix transcriptional regulator [Planctomycetes bacterium]|nr:helix-turn-helix transcriptional regulator [Planctomycetota bacterium]
MVSTDPPADCPIHDVQRRIGGKWHLVVLWHLRGGQRGFAELERAIGDVSAKALTEALRHLEQEGLIARTVRPVVPPRVDYALTPTGTTLVPILEALQEWSLRHRRADAREV